MSEPVVAGCTAAKSVSGPLGVAISPEGDSVYVSASSEGAEAAFSRDVKTGALAQVAEPYECVTANASGCAEGSNDVVGLSGARRVTVSPDGINVYVAGQNANSIVELARAVKPKISELIGGSGSELGGTAVVIMGSGFVAGSTVEFGGKPADSVVAASSAIVAFSPPGSGTVDVSVTNPTGPSEATPADKFAYTPPAEPTVTEVVPHEGSEAGGTAVTITGSGILSRKRGGLRRRSGEQRRRSTRRRR